MDQFEFGARFRVLDLLGRGGMGTVYRVWDAVLDREVALKVVESSDPRAVSRLKSEFRRVADLVHPNLVQLHDLFVSNGNAWFTMEAVRGGAFDVALRSGAVAKQPMAAEGLGDFLAAFEQVLSGVGALHAAGVIHRDLKPSNVLVSGSGRAVVLDFGVALPMFEVGPHTDAAELAGTMLYMAPELFERVAGPEVDVFALGVMAYVTLAGRPPVAGTLSQVMKARLNRVPHTPLLELATWVPAPLAALVDAMLDPEPERRGDVGRVRDVVQSLLGAPPSSPMRRRSSRVFVGREAHLNQLRSDWAEVPRQGVRLVDVSGASGIGKTELVREFAVSLAAGGALVLRGGCHPRESVPFRAVDELLDGLARHIDYLSEAEAVQYAPQDVEALVDLFPLFRRVGAWGAKRRSIPGLGVADRRDRRLDGFNALREVLEHVASERRTLAIVDDFHWADLDSCDLLSYLMAAPAPPLMWVVVSRDEERDAGPIRELRGGLLGQAVGGTTRVDVGPLDRAECVALAAALVVGRSDEDAVRRAVDDAQGSPLFLGELVEAWDRSPGATLDELLWQRVEGLPALEQSLVEAVAVAEHPTPIGALLAAVGVGLRDEDAVERLVRRAILRLTESRGERAVATYHHRLGEVVVAKLAPERRSAWHGRLADVLVQRADDDAERLLRHFEGAGRPVEAAEYARKAAAAAEGRLAFHRAAELHGLILDRGWAEQPTATRLQLAESLANAGLVARAAAVFHEVSEDPRLHDDERLVARTRSAQLDLSSGRWGADGLVPVLEAVGLQVPSRWWSAAAYAAWYRFRAWASRPPVLRQVSSVDVARLEVLWTAATTYAQVDHLVALATGSRLLFEAKRLGDARRLSRALAFRAGSDAFLFGRSGRRSALQRLGEATTLARERGGRADVAYCAAVAGTVHWARGEWSDVIRTLDEFFRDEMVLHEVKPGGPTETYAYLLSALTHVGEFARLTRMVPPMYSAFDLAGDRTGRSVCALGQPSLAWLVADRPEELASISRAVLAGWGQERFLTPHYHALITQAYLDLYRGDVVAAFEGLQSRWAAFEASMIPRIEVVGSEMWFLRGRVALDAAAAGVGAAADVARQAARQVGATTLPWSPVLTLWLTEGLRQLDGGAPDWARVAEEAKHAGLPHLAAGARWRSGDCAPALDQLAALGAVAPQALRRAVG